MKNTVRLICFAMLLAFSSPVYAQLFGRENTAGWVTNRAFGDMATSLNTIKTNTSSVTGSIQVTNTLGVTNALFTLMDANLAAISNLTANIQAINYANSNMLYGQSNMLWNVWNSTNEAGKAYAIGVGFRVETNTPTALTNGTVGMARINASRAIVPAGYSDANNSIATTETTPTLPQSFGGDGTWLLLSAVSTNTVGEWFNADPWNAWSFIISTPATVTTNETVYIDVSLNSGTNWVNVYSTNLATTNNLLYQLDGKFQNVRARVNTTGTVVSVVGKAGYK